MILVIDDDFVTMSKMCAILSRYGACHQASNARQALELIKLSQEKGTLYDVMYIDINLPDMNGLDLVKLINQKEYQYNLPVSRKVIVTTESSLLNVQVATQQKCEAFLVKPITPDVIDRKMIQMGFRKEYSEDRL